MEDAGLRAVRVDKAAIKRGTAITLLLRLQELSIKHVHFRRSDACPAAYEFAVLHESLKESVIFRL